MASVSSNGERLDHSYNDGNVRGDTKGFGTFSYGGDYETCGASIEQDATNRTGSLGGADSDSMFETSHMEQQSGPGSAPAENAEDVREDKED